MQPLILITVGYIIGIIWGLYLKLSIAPIIFLFFGGFIVFAKKIRKLAKYRWVVVAMGVAAVISNFQIRSLENKFDTFFTDGEEIEVIRSNCNRRRKTVNIKLHTQ